MNMFEHDRSASRGVMATRGLFVFEHSSPLGKAPAHALFDLVEVTRVGDPAVPARKFADYAIHVDESALPKGIALRRLV